MQNNERAKLMFAGLCRISADEDRAKVMSDGDSIVVQRSQIEGAVKALGADPKRIVWYSGHEHSLTDKANEDRKIFKGLLRDAASPDRAWNALNVAKMDRVGRSYKAWTALQDTLRANGIRFFLLQTEITLGRPADKLTFGMQGLISQFTAESTLERSMEQRYSRARAGKYTGGPLFGRKWNKEAGRYEVIPEVARWMTDACKRVLSGESVYRVCQSLGILQVVFYKRLDRCGSIIKWRMGTKHLDGFSPSTEFEVPVPPVVPDAILSKIQARRARNRLKFRHGKEDGMEKTAFALRGLCRCAKCGYALVPQKVQWRVKAEKELKRARRRGTNTDHTKRYYRHQNSPDIPALCYCRHRAGEMGPPGPEGGWVHVVDAEKLELQVLAHLFEEQDSGKLYSRAVKRLEEANGHEVKALSDEIAAMEGQLKDVQGIVKKLAASIERLDEKDAIEVEDRLKQRKVEEAKLIDQLARKRVALEAVPSVGMLKARTARVKALIESFEEEMERAWMHKDPMAKAKALAWPERRRLLLSLLEGEGYGAYVSRQKDGKIRVEIRSDLSPITFKM